MAMSDNMTISDIGMEQIIVSVSLLVISLYCLANTRSKVRLRQFGLYILCGGRIGRWRRWKTNNEGNGTAGNSNTSGGTSSNHANVAVTVTNSSVNANSSKNGNSADEDHCDEEVRLIGANKENQQSPQSQSQHPHVRFQSTPPPLSTTPSTSTDTKINNSPKQKKSNNVTPP